MGKVSGLSSDPKWVTWAVLLEVGMHQVTDHDRHLTGSFTYRKAWSIILVLFQKTLFIRTTIVFLGIFITSSTPITCNQDSI
jgi:hypothetical protein